MEKWKGVTMEDWEDYEEDHECTLKMQLDGMLMDIGNMPCYGVGLFFITIDEHGDYTINIATGLTEAITREHLVLFQQAIVEMANDPNAWQFKGKEEDYDPEFFAELNTEKATEYLRKMKEMVDQDE